MIWRWDSISATNASQRRKDCLHQTKYPSALPASERCPGQHKGKVSRVYFTSARPVRFRSGMRLVQLCPASFASRPKQSSISGIKSRGDQIAGAGAVCAQNCHHLPHLPVLRTSAANFPGVHDRCCNSHFGRQVIRGHFFLPELH
jgi:hypothetical protein